MSKPRVLILTASEGHQSISSAIEEILAHQYQVKQFKEKFIESILAPYKTIYQTIPQLASIPWYLSQTKNIENIIQKEIHKKISSNLKSLIIQFKPNIIISCHWAYIYTLNTLSSQLSFQTINILSDPRSTHKATFNFNSLNLVFDNKTIIPAKINSKHILISGWFTQKKFYQPLSTLVKNKIYKRLNFNPKIPTFLICGGSEGMSSIIKILPSFINSPQKIQLIIICGSNKILKNILSILQSKLSLLTPTKKSNLKLKVLGFTKNMDQYIKISNLVIGKAGPNLLFETIACQKPFFAISNMPGQEEGNLDLIKEFHIGIVEKNIVKANKILTNIVKNPHSLDQYSTGIKKLRQHNLNSKEVLLEQVSNII